MVAASSCPEGVLLMRIQIGVLHFVRGLSPDFSERRRLGAAVVSLLRKRRRSFTTLSPLLRLVPTLRNAKLQMWQALARTSGFKTSQRTSAAAPAALVDAIRFTQAYADAKYSLRRDRNGFMQRGFEYQQLRRRWVERPPERVVVFHHYDRRGLLPRSWQEALLELQEARWQVVLSSPHLDPVISASLQPAGVQIVGRTNIGLCLGAYRDLSLLLHSTKAVERKLRALVLCNDSNLLVQPPSVLLAQLERWTAELEMDPRPVLAGLTDSAQRDCYHLQSFLLYANRALLQHPAWLRFWLQYTIDGSKDDLINQGEIGLSQALLETGVELRPAYPLVHGLLNDPSMAAELLGYGIVQPEHVNQSLFAWRSLLARGFPMVKKHVLFQLAEHQGQSMAIAELASWIPEERHPLLTHDIEQLLISRYSGGSPRMS